MVGINVRLGGVRLTSKVCRTLTFFWHGRLLKKAKKGVHLKVDTIASSDGVRKVCWPDGY